MPTSRTGDKLRGNADKAAGKIKEKVSRDPVERAKGVAKFDRFTQKIGHPDKFRDYSDVKIRRDDLLGNFQRAAVARGNGGGKPRLKR